MRRSSELGEDMAALVEKVGAGVLPASDLHERGLRRAVKPRRWSAGSGGILAAWKLDEGLTVVEI